MEYSVYLGTPIMVLDILYSLLRVQKPACAETDLQGREATADDAGCGKEEGQQEESAYQRCCAARQHTQEENCGRGGVRTSMSFIQACKYTVLYTQVRSKGTDLGVQ